MLLSTRDAGVWYPSAANTIFLSFDRTPPDRRPWMEAIRRGLRDRFSDDFENEDAMTAADDAHNAAMRAEIPVARLVDSTPSDGGDCP